MPGTEATTQTGLPVQQPYVSMAVKKTVQLPHRTFGRIKESSRKPINDKGYQFSINTKSNPQIGGGMRSGNTMLIGGSDAYITLVVQSTVTNGARAWDGGALRQMSDGKYYGLNRGEQDVLDADRFATEHNKDICFSGITKSRGVMAAIPVFAAGPNESTVTFLASKGGSYYLREMEGRSFLGHRPVTFVPVGGTTPFVLKRVPTPLTAVFAGDMTGGTAIAANDFLVPTGTAGGASSINLGITSLERMTPVTGDYFTANVDVEDKVRGIQHDVLGQEVTRAVLEFADGLFTFKIPGMTQGTRGHTDIYSPTQQIKMLFQAEGPLRIPTSTGAVAYNPKITYGGWNGRAHFEDVHLLGNVWHIFYMPECYRYVQREFGTWDYDGQEVRGIPDSGSWRDAIAKHYICVDQVAHEDPRMNIMLINCSTDGAPLQTS